MNYEHTTTQSGLVTISSNEGGDAAMVGPDVIVLMVKRSDTGDLKARLEDLADQAMQYVEPSAE